MKKRLFSTENKRMLKPARYAALMAAFMGLLAISPNAKAASGFSLGDAANFAILDEGNGTNDLNITGDTINGSIGIGDPSGKTTTELQLTGVTVTGNVEFAGAIKDSGTTSDTIKGSLSGNDTQVQTDLNYLNTLSATLAAESGTSLSISQGSNVTINASSGKLDSSGNYVFNVTALTGSGSTITINGNNLGHNVVINFTNAGINPDFTGCTIKITGGLTASQVLFNVADGDTLTLGGNTITGTFLDPKGAINGTGDTLNGHVYGGGTGNSTYTGNTIVNVPVVSPI